MLYFGQVALQLLQQGTEPPMAVSDMIFQGVVAVLFATFALALLRITTNAREKSDAAWQKFMNDQAAAFTTALKDQASLLTGAIDREREQRKEVMGQAYREFSANMDRVAGGLGELTKELGLHDDSAQERHVRILEALRTINGGSGR